MTLPIDSYLHQADARRQHIHRQLLHLIKALYSISALVVEGIESGGSEQQTLSVVLHAFATTICHLDDSINRSFMDPLKCVQDATKMLFQHPTIPDAHRRFMLSQFSANAGYAVTYTSLPNDDARATFVGDMYATHNPVTEQG